MRLQRVAVGFLNTHMFTALLVSAVACFGFGPGPAKATEPTGFIFQNGFEAFVTACGDGVISGGEVCDDFNSLACGTCNSSCNAVITPTRSSGMISVVAAANLLDGESFTVADGLNPAVTFEFDLNVNGVGAQNIGITISNLATANQVRDQVIAAVNNLSNPVLGITALNAGAGTVGLLNDVAYALGNLPLLETVNNTGFQVLGMSGGLAGDCPATIGCKSNADCASNLCLNHQCN